MINNLTLQQSQLLDLGHKIIASKNLLIHSPAKSAN